AAAAHITDEQFQSNGLYGANANTASFTDAGGDVIVEAGARITTHEPESVTQSGGYVLLMGHEAHNAGDIATHKGQTTLAAGDDFYIRKGAGTETNQASTTRGNEVASTWEAGSEAGVVTNDGLIVAREGDITLTGHDVRQQGVAVATTTVNQRGTVHLLNSASDTGGKVTLAEDAVTTVLIDDNGDTALDSQRNTLINNSKDLDGQRDDMITGVFDNIGLMSDRRDQSRVEIVSGADVVFEDGSLTLATGGQIAVQAAGRTQVNRGASLDVSGLVGVQVAMESNNVLVNVQGNEQRDSPDNRDSGMLNNSDIWVDRRTLVLVPAGTGGYEKSDRWYTAGGLLEVSGYLDTQGRGVGEWAAAGGTVQLGGREVVTQVGSAVNVSGGTLDVQAGTIRQSWLRGADGRLYNVSNAPGGLLYTGLYQGYEVNHERWDVTRHYYNPLIAPRSRQESGYTVGRDAGALIVSAPTAVLEGDIVADVFNGERQSRAQDAGLASYQQAQNRVARRGRLAVGRYGQYGLENAYDSEIRIGAFDDISEQLTLESDLGERLNTVWLDAGRLNEQALGGLDLVSGGSIAVENDLTLAEGGQLRLVSGQVDVDATVTARGGNITFSNVSEVQGVGNSSVVLTDVDGASDLRLGENGRLDVRGLWSNALLEEGQIWKQAYVDGGTVTVEGTQDVTLAEGSLIDVSSGAAVRSDRSLLGGRGGDVTLRANIYRSGLADSNSRLLLGAKVLGYGVEGGGTLTVETGQAVLVGDQGLKENGLLQAGETAPTDLTLVEDLVVREGQLLPLDYSYERTSAAAGEQVGGGELEVSTSDPLVTMADWVVPDAEHGTFYVTYQSPAGEYKVAYSGALVPAGSSIIAKTPSNLGAWAADYVVPADVFPNGVPLVPSASVVDAGSPAPSDITIEAGSVLASGTTVPSNVRVKEWIHLTGEDFTTGFSSYEINGHQGLLVSEGAEVDVTMPVLRMAEGALQATTYEDALEQWLPPLFLEAPLEQELHQRAGASLTLKAARRDSPAGSAQAQSLIVGKGAEVTVDPGQTLALVGSRQITVDGTLRAPGGQIHILNPMAGGLLDAANSMWIGENAVLDTAGRAYVVSDMNGQRYGEVLSGGQVVLGSLRPDEVTDSNLYPVNNLMVIVREGAVIDISGASADLNLGRSKATPVASDGGSLEIRSKAGIAFDGTLRALGGGATASGGSLTVMLETMSLGGGIAPDPRYAVPRSITLTQTHGGDLPADLQPGQDDEGLPFGAARFAVDDLVATGLDHLSLWSRDALLFEGDTRIDLGGSLSLTSAVLGAAPDTLDISVDLVAPYVELGGRTETPPSGGGDGSSAFTPYFRPDDQNPLSNLTSDDSRLTVTASLIDLGTGNLAFGAKGGYEVAQFDEAPLDLPGFASVVFDSQSDIRLRSIRLTTGRALDFLAERVYATTHSGNRIRVGSGLESNEPQEDAVIRFERRGSGEVDTPLSVFGSISLQAPRIEQGGALFAPLGSITMGPQTGFGIDMQTEVVLREGSLTSISAAGLVLPYGYTEDGQDYYYNGEEVAYTVAGVSANDPRINGGISFETKALTVEQGAVLDVSAGGELRGVGFSSGRGGSVDILNTALANAAPWHTGEQDAGAYAIVPGLSDSQAPLDPALDGPSQVGQQITIGEGVPGVPAGTYTLLPAEYALMPGGYRVELGAGTQYGTGGVAQNAAGVHTTAVTVGNALTGIDQSLPVTATLMAGDTVRRYADYNETTLSQWVAERKAEFGDPGLMVPLVPEDVRPLEFNFGDADPAADQVFQFAGELRDTQVEGGRGGMVLFNGADYEVVVDGGSRTDDRVTLVDTDLDALGATLLSLGTSRVGRFGSLTANGTTVVRSGATLKAATVILGGIVRGTDAVVVESGATLDTRGEGTAGWTGENGFLLQPQSGSNAAFLVVSNDLMQFGAAGSQGSVRIEDGAALHSEGTVALLAPGGLDIGDIELSARDFLISMEDINIGTNAALAQAEAQGVLSDGWQLTQSILDGLLGLGELESFSLQTANSINFFGPVTLDTYDPDTGESRAALRFISPAIYGLGADGDTATIRTDQFIWSGLGYSSGREGTSDWEVGSVAPGEVIAGGAGTGSGGFMVDANEVVFGFNGMAGDQTANATLERLMLGFGDVTFQANERITSELYGELSVYQQQTGDAFSGGNLTLSSPVLTGQAGSEMTYRTGGNLLVTRPADAAAVDPANLDLGAQLSLEGNNVRVEGSIIAPSGKVAIASIEDLVLTAGSLINVAGRAVAFFDVTKYSFGGAVSLESAEGNVQQSAGNRINVSAPYSDAGKLEATAANGTVDLAGELVARNPEEDPEGEGEGGTIRIKANTLPGFVALNQRLSDGGFDYLRGFETNEGDLTLGEEVRARHIEATANGGDLIVNGNLRAGGDYAGSIYLAAANDLRVTNGSTLDASGDSLKVDSYGDPIEGSNRAIINLTSRDGRLVLGDNVMLDVSAGGENRGTIDLNARRLGDPSATSATGNDVAVDAGSNLTVNGAKRVSVNGFWTYDDAPNDPENKNTQVVDQDWLDKTKEKAPEGEEENPHWDGLDGVHEHSKDFINAALANEELQQRLAGLKDATGDAFSLRPGVEIVSATEDGNLRIDGDLNFAGYRYGPGVDETVYGSGTAGVFVMRAGGDLEVNGSVTDGFKLPPNTPDSSYTLDFELDPGLLNGAGQLTQDFELEENLTLRSGWSLGSVHGSGSPYLLPFDLTETLIQVSPNVQIPFDGELWDPVTLPFGATLPADIVLPVQINDLARPGTTYGPGLVSAGTTVGFVSLPAGTTIFQGSTFSVAMSFRPSVIPAGTDLQGINVIDAKEYGEDLQLETGFVLPKGFGISSFKGEEFEQPIWPMASAMNEGAESWDLRLVSGADLASASSRSTQVLTAGGDLILDNDYKVVTYKGLDADVVREGLSVIRTGTGDLELIASRDYLQNSRFSIYTAGTAVEGAPALGAERTEDGTVLNTDHALYEDAAAAATALINTGGGNVLLQVGRDIQGYESNGETGHWLWAASDTETGNQQVWGINPGNYGLAGSSGSQYLDLLGFDGIGTLGGGNLTVTAGGDVGAHTRTSDGQVLGGVFLMVGGAGWVDGEGQRHTYGGGDLKLDVAGIIDPVFLGSTLDQGGVASLRGDVQVRAKALGDLWQTYEVASHNTDPRPDDELLLVNKRTFGGLRLVLGDAQATLHTQGDALVNVQDPSTNGVVLRTDHTEALVFSTGGDIGVGGGAGDSNLPARFSAVAADGSIYGNGFSPNALNLSADVSPDGWLEFLAWDSIYTLGLHTAYDASLSGMNVTPARFYANEGDIYQLYYGYYGERRLSPSSPLVLDNKAGRPAYVRAGRDIVEYGGGAAGLVDTPAMGHYSPTDVSLIEAGRDLIHINVQVVGPGTLELTAGRNLYQADKGWIRSVGPFTDGLASGVVTSGGADIAVNVGMGTEGPDYRAVIDTYLNSANLADPDRTLADQPDMVAKTYEEELAVWLTARYGEGVLEGTDALSYFQGLAPEQQRIFLREVYYAELRAGGREYNDANGPRYGSYLRGRRMIETLLPKVDSEMGTSGYNGDVTMLTAMDGALGEKSGLIRTEGGGNIQMLVPGGDLIIGLEAVRPENGDNGILTQGSGDIQLFSQGDIALGLSRIMTTYGGDIFAWANAGDINAGRGAKTTLVYTPPRRVYDDLGNVTLSPSVPSTGAGIATLAPIPEVPSGDIDLIAPLGVIDAGEAGIRVSGNVNVAALQVVNADNIQVQGESVGMPVVVAVNVGALTSASAASSAAADAAQDSVSRARNEARQNQPSIFSVRVLGFGNESASSAEGSGGVSAAPGSRLNGQPVSYRPDGMVQVLGDGKLDPQQADRLTSDERRRLGL
ncbi:MAG: filamentous hemagglutinin, partial [Pusillimonas sp.]|nr:filamentous hemagglutinin [Pusillimonas sp.]